MAGIGTHQELRENCQIYREIVASQLTEEVIAWSEKRNDRPHRPRAVRDPAGLFGPIGAGRTA